MAEEKEVGQITEAVFVSPDMMKCIAKYVRTRLCEYNIYIRNDEIEELVRDMHKEVLNGSLTYDEQRRAAVRRTVRRLSPNAQILCQLIMESGVDQARETLKMSKYEFYEKVWPACQNEFKRIYAEENRLDRAAASVLEGLPLPRRPREGEVRLVINSEGQQKLR